MYEVVDDVNDHKAVKVVNKSNIKTKRNKTKVRVAGNWCWTVGLVG